MEEVAWVVAAATQWVAAVAATQWAAEEVRTPCFRLGSVALHSFPSFQVFVDVHSLITNRFFFDGHTNTAGMGGGGGGNSMGGGGGTFLVRIVRQRAVNTNALGVLHRF